jgi:c-di-GMP phosphodiesterase
MPVPFGDGGSRRGQSRFHSSTPALSAALANAGSAAPTLFVAREAIVDRTGDVVAYELHFHPGVSPEGTAPDERAGAADLLAAVIELGVERLSNGRPLLLGVTPAILRDVDVLELTGEQVGFVLIGADPAPDALAHVARIVGAGRTLALAHYRPTAESEAVLPHAGLVKIEVAGRSADELRRLCAAAGRFGARPVAEGVDDRETSVRCIDAGFVLFQGDFHARAAMVSGRGSRADQHATLALLGRLSAASTSVDELERVVSSDLGLTVSTLRAVNSAAIGLPNRITSIRQAIVLLGGRAVHSLAALLAMTDLSDSPVELSRRALIRAATCEQLARGAGAEHPDRYFTAGMLSMADALLDLPLERIVAELPLADEIGEALTEGSGPIGQVLTAVIWYERARFRTPSDAPALVRRDIGGAYLAAVDFADGLTSDWETRRAA